MGDMADGKTKGILLSDDPDEQLGYAILGVPFDGEREATGYDSDWHRMWSDGRDDGLVANTHGCWGFFPAVNG